MDKLLQVSKSVQDEFMAKKVQDDNKNKKEAQDIITHKMQIIHIDED
jgi:hypothetical protein